ncbi:hypothetical protein V6N13_108271 [Hibiscus sabdariffa]
MGEEERKELNMESKKEEESESTMTPWEQHAKVISIPRFDYKAPSSLFQRSHSAFLITCTIKREKSATKETMSILSKYVGPFNGDTSGSSGCSHANADTKRRKICTEENDQNIANSVDSPEITNGADDSSISANTDKSEELEFVLSLVKLTRSGLLLLSIPVENSLDTIDVVSKIFCDLESGSLKSPLRGTEESQVKIPKDASKNSNLSVLLDRNKCFSVVAAAVKAIVSDSVVDLKSPEVSILVELLPLSGVPNGSLVVGVSVPPLNLVSTKPRLCIKPLVGVKNGKKAS